MSEKDKITFEDIEKAFPKKSVYDHPLSAIEAATRAIGEMNFAAAGVSEQIRRAVEAISQTTEKKKPERWPKTALLIPEDGTRPDGLSTKTAARIMYNGKEYFLRRPERYVLSVFVYAENIEDTTAANNNAKSKMTREEIYTYIRLRNSVFALFYLGQNLHNDVWTFCELSEMIARLSNREDRETDAMAANIKSLKTISNLQRLRLEAQFRAVDMYCKTYTLPEYLTPGIVAMARFDFKTAVPSTLFDEYANTVQAEEIKQMTFNYLTQRTSKFSKFI